MRIDHGPAPVQFFEHRPERGIARVLVAEARHQREAVCFQHVERVFDFAQAALDVRQRQRGEDADNGPDNRAPASPRNRWSRAQAGAPSATSPNHTPSANDRRDRRRDAVLVHVLERLVRATSCGGGFSPLTCCGSAGDVTRRHEMMMDVDAVRLAADQHRCRGFGDATGQAACRRRARQAPRETGAAARRITVVVRHRARRVIHRHFHCLLLANKACARRHIDVTRFLTCEEYRMRAAPPS